MTDNPHLYPASPAAAVGAGRLRAEPALLPAGAGAQWLGQAWELFKKAPALLIAMLVLYFVIGMAVGMVPVIGELFMSLTLGIWMAGWAITFDKLQRSEPITIGDLFAGFSHPQAGRLFVIGALYLGLFVSLVILTIALVVAAFGIAGFSEFSEFGDITQAGAHISANLGIFFVLLLVVVSGIFLIFGYIAYAPVLVVMHDVPVLDACALSLRALLRNWLPMTVYGLIIVGLCFASVFTLFIGMLVIMPLMIGAGYVSYRQMFLEE
ncbi:MAG: BPSS1780 family membrane protein [Pseudomonadota bacterium]